VFLKLKFVHSLTFKLIAVGVLLVATGSALRYVMMEKTLKAGIEQVVNAQQLSLAQYVAQDIDHKVLARRQALVQVAGVMPLALLNKPAEMETWLRAQTPALALFPAGLVLVRADGHGAVADYPRVPGRSGLDFNDRDWFAAARDGAAFTVGKPTIGRAVKEAVVNMSVPVRKRDQGVVAVLMGVTPLAASGFLDLVESGNVGKTGGLLLVSPKDQIFVTASEANMRLKPLPAPGVNPMHDRAMDGWRGTGITRNARGTEELVAVVSVPNANWFVVVRTPVAEAFQMMGALLSAQVQNSIKVSLMLILVLVLTLTFLFRPLKQGAAQMRAMARGERPLGHLPVVRPDEAGDMVTSFNELVDKLQQTESRMTYLAHHDTLTGLPNRMAFQQSLGQSVALADRQQASLALLFIDLDGFKAVNDNCGHDVGDQLLTMVAARLRACVRASDVVGRLGGDEFVVLLTDNVTESHASQIAQKVIDHVSQPYQIPGAQPVLGASIGIAMYPAQAQNADQLLIAADTAMYVAKRAGGSRQHLA
jgi:diguanylate cyclase (GGDEF)-like protein